MSNQGVSVDPSLISTFANVVAIREGFGASPGNKPTRTHNPLDLGNTDDGSTVDMLTDQAGWNAAENQIRNFFSGTTKYNPNMTIAQIAAVYAKDPATGPAWAKLLGVSVDTPLKDLASGKVAYNQVSRPGGASSSVGSTQSGNGETADTSPFYSVNDADAAAILPVSGSTISDEQIGAALNAAYPSLIINAGLAQAPWFADPNILQINGATSAIPMPVTFQVFFDTSGSPLPIVIALSASVRSFERSLKHVIHHQPTRTGILATFWGLQPDMIVGSGSTGAFMNQLGVTDFLSTRYASEDFFDQYSDGVQTLTDAALAGGALRIAAKDAFVELLSLFKNNGTVYYQNENYTGDTSMLNQTGPNLWSPITASTIAMNAGSRNDVMTRGTVAMNFRNSTYHGYFKSLTWDMDAGNPFQWNFNFVFQVERTVTNLPIPDDTMGGSDANIAGIHTEMVSLALPMRAEKRIIPTIVDLGDAATVDDFSITAALSRLSQYVVVSIPGRGVDDQGNPDPSQAAYFQFLINPSDINISRQTLDEQAMSRSGWQIGVWGEGPPVIALRGRTPGKYFANGLTDLLTEYTMSYRNLASLEVFFENNGYWFEGEQLAENPLAADYTRQRIKMHQTVTLAVGEFIWDGCFDTMNVSESADNPFLADFSLTFTVWRERFRTETPYQNSIGNIIERGHTAQVPLALATGAAQQNWPSLPPRAAATVQFQSSVPPNINPTSPALDSKFLGVLPDNLMPDPSLAVDPRFFGVLPTNPVMKGGS
jgi:hypothetical protein